MNIVLVSNAYPPAVGGLAIAVERLAVELARQRHQVTVVVNAPPWSRLTQGQVPGLAIVPVPVYCPRLVTAGSRPELAASLGRALLSPVVGGAAVVRFRHLLTRLRPDIVNLHYIGENAVLSYLVGRRERSRFVVSVHGNDIERHAQRGRLARHLTRATLRRADRVLANSQALLAQTLAIEPSVTPTATVMPNGVDVEDFEAAAPFVHARKYVVCVGNLTLKKGQDVLLRAFVDVRRRHPDVDLLIVGDGRERTSYQRLVDDLGLGKGVWFLGAVGRREVASLVAGSELVVVPSRREPFGMIVLEAMAAGRPMVASRVDGIPELVTDGATGVLVTPEDPPALAQAVSALLDDPGRGRRLGNSGRAVARRYAWPAIAERYVAVYAAALDAGATRVAEGGVQSARARVWP